MTKSASVTAIIVGGPETRHLRIPKQTLPFGDSTVTGKTLAAYLDAGVSEVILVLGYKADTVESELAPLPEKVRVIRNPLFDEGITSFVQAGLRECADPNQDFCIGLSDQPLLSSELIAEFLKEFQSHKESILVPVFQSSLGLPAFFKASMRDAILNLSSRNDLWDLLKEHGNDLVDHPTGFSAVVRSIDEMDDYHLMLRMAGLPLPELPTAPEPEQQPIEETVSETSDEEEQPEVDEPSVEPTQNNAPA